MGESTWSWSKTAASNATADSSINYAEGQSPGSINNSARSMMAALAKQRDDTSGALTTAGGTTVYTLTTNQGLGTLADGVRVHAVVNATNTGSSSLNVDGTGSKVFRKIVGGVETPLAAGELPVGYHAVFQYDASANSASGAWIFLNPPQLPAPGVLWGMQVSNGTDATNDLDITAGYCADDTNTITITLSAITKRLDAAWAVGTGNGGRDTGSIANTTYHIFAIYRSDTGVSDVLFSASLASPTMPTGYTHKRRILSMQRVAGAWQSIYQHGDYVLLKTPVADSSAALTTTVGDVVLGSVPNGIVVMAHIATSASDSAATTISTFHSKLGNDTGPSGSYGTSGVSATGATATQIHTTQLVLTNSAQTIRADTLANLDTTTINTLGWYDYRGRQF